MAERSHPRLPRRVAVIGNSGSGKSTLARKIARIIGGKFIELDDIGWLPNWTLRDRDEVRDIVDNLTSFHPRWASAGNYFRSGSTIWTRADTVVWIDFGFMRTFWQLLKRTAWRAWSKERICNGNHESFRHSFCSRESMLLYIVKAYWRTRKTCAGRIRALEQDKRNMRELTDSVRIVHLRSPSEVATWLESLQAVSEASS